MSMKKQWISAALVLLLMLLIPIYACADVIYPAPDTLVAGEPVSHLLATLDPGGTVWNDPATMPDGLYLSTVESEEAVNVYLCGTPSTPGDYAIIIRYNDVESICTFSVLPAEEPEPASPVSVSVESLPLRVDYTAGDTLDPEGLSLRVEMSDGSFELVSADYSLYPTRLDNADPNCLIEVNYHGLLCYFEVNVEPAAEVVEGIGVLTLPVKRTYRVGEELDPAGLGIRVYTNNGTRDVYTDLICQPTRFTEAGTQIVTVIYEEKTCTFSVTVLEQKVPVGLIVFQPPDKVDYTVGEKLDTRGLILMETDNGGESSLLDSGYTCEPGYLDTPGIQTITVRLGELACSFEVNVNAAPGEPDSRPIQPEVEPAEPTSILIIPEEENQNKDFGPGSQSGKLLVAVIAAAALVALVILGVYVFVMNRSGREYFADSIRDLFRRR